MYCSVGAHCYSTFLTIDSVIVCEIVVVQDESEKSNKCIGPLVVRSKLKHERIKSRERGVWLHVGVKTGGVHTKGDTVVRDSNRVENSSKFLGVSED